MTLPTTTAITNTKLAFMLVDYLHTYIPAYIIYFKQVFYLCNLFTFNVIICNENSVGLLSQNHLVILTAFRRSYPNNYMHVEEQVSAYAYKVFVYLD
jgi:hypothetical protein